jgi:hypothetical protein
MGRRMPREGRQENKEGFGGVFCCFLLLLCFNPEGHCTEKFLITAFSQLRSLRNNLLESLVMCMSTRQLVIPINLRAAKALPRSCGHRPLVGRRTPGEENL